MYIYIQSEKSLWTVGFYKPSGEFVSESDHDSSDIAAERVHWLNGGNDDFDFDDELQKGLIRHDLINLI